MACKVAYDSSFSSNASTELEASTYTIKPRNIWHMVFDISKDSVGCGELGFNWKGNMVISLFGEGYVLKHKGVKDFKFELQGPKGQVLLTMVPTMKWSKLAYNYTIQTTDALKVDFPIEVLLLCCGYSTNLYMLR